MRKLNIGFYTTEGFSRHWTQEMEQEDVCLCPCVCTRTWRVERGRKGEQ